MASIRRRRTPNGAGGGCTCSTSRVPVGELPPAPAALAHGVKEGEYKHVGTFQYQPQQLPLAAAEDGKTRTTPSSTADRGGGDESFHPDNPIKQRHGTFYTEGLSVVTAEVVEDMDVEASEDLPAVTLTADAVVEIPALSLSLLTDPPSWSTSCGDDHHHHPAGGASHASCTTNNHNNTVSTASSSASNMRATTILNHNKTMSIPEVVATPVESAPSCCMYEPSQNGSGGSNTVWNRPQFLSATVVRDSTDQKFGIKFHCDHGGSYPKISATLQDVAVEKGGLLSQAPFCVGDRLISINKQSCRGMSPADFSTWLTRLTGTITFVVHHPGGDPTLVESFLRKPHPGAKTGIGLVYSPRQNRLRVKQVHYAGLLVEGLLQVEDRIVAINHMPCHYGWDARTAAEQIAHSPLWVSIVARRHCDAGVVLTVSEGSTSSHGNSGSGAMDGEDTELLSLATNNTAVASSSSSSGSGRRRFGILPRRRSRRQRQQAQQQQQQAEQQQAEQQQQQQQRHPPQEQQSRTRRTRRFSHPIMASSFASTAEC